MRSSFRKELNKIEEQEYIDVSLSLGVGSRSSRNTFKRPRSKADQVLEKISKRLDQQQQTSDKKMHDAFGAYVAEKLRSLQKNMECLCQKLINDAIFMAEVGKLNITSKIVTEDMSPPTPTSNTQSEKVIITAFLGAVDPEE
ncbi:uncharacterized protein LOC106669195 [Cimex lectularius]|uniref:Uncharacterized protein n=1 Tax=Cimex lectularius TaxID=79782 RepID=A0A8I6RYH4_CIMLE|nr:uncharacterized protein LOC106669195 [Cimex lectularius]